MKCLLLQIRDADDPIGAQEFDVFVHALDCPKEQIEVCDLLRTSPTPSQIDAVDYVIIGGSGNYSAIGNAPWLLDALDTLRHLYAIGKPTFAICWGHQAIGRALGGTTIHDPARGELGPVKIDATEAAANDPLFGPMGKRYLAFQGHEDRVAQLPDDAILLASTPVTPIQAFTFPDRPIYAVQFHPELSRQMFLERMKRYPHYVQRITGHSYQVFEKHCTDTRDSNGQFGTGNLLRRFVQSTVGAR